MKHHLLYFLLLVILVINNFDGICQTRDELVMGNQLTFTCDNNFLLFNGEDGYYTSGLILRYDHISQKQNANSTKRIFSYELGQQIYTAHSRKILPNNTPSFPGGIEQIDRPIAGYLFGKITYYSFYNNSRMLGLGVSVGTVGENSFGRSTQEFWHQMIGVKNHWNWVWDYQVNNEIGINVHGTFASSLINSELHSTFQITPVTEVTLGTTFTNISQGVLLQVGKLRPISSSSYWNSKLQLTRADPDDHHTELFLYYNPEVKYQLYNATIQGGLLRDDKGQILSEAKPLVFSHEIGVRFSAPRYCIAYQITLQSREAKNQFYRQSFASLILTYRFAEKVQE